ncbi:MAG: DNA topoisomerase IB [Pyrinomonadaceae bacterium]
MKNSNDESSKVNGVLERGSRIRWIRRIGLGQRNFRYVNAEGQKITAQTELERIKSLVIPPAWKEVRICPSPRGKLQAIGIDTAGRIQYRYNEKFSIARQAIKFARVAEFGHALPTLRQQLNADIALEGYSKSKVLAVMIRLINDLYIRVGSEESVKLYKTYGVTTLRNRHLHIKRNGELHFNFVGKHHIRHRRVVVDKELATIMSDLKAMGGSKLFNYQDDVGKACPIKPRDINDYIKNATGGEFSAKDFRTWGASVLAAGELAEIGAAENNSQLKKNIVRIIKTVAERLGNTPAVCRNSYVHPTVIACYEKGITIGEFVPRTKRQIHKLEPEYLPEEAGLLKLLANEKCK